MQLIVPCCINTTVQSPVTSKQAKADWTTLSPLWVITLEALDSSHTCRPLCSGLRIRVARNVTQGKPTSAGIAFPPNIPAWQPSEPPQWLSEARGVHVSRTHALIPPQKPILGFIQMHISKWQSLSLTCTHREARVGSAGWTVLALVV